MAHKKKAHMKDKDRKEDKKDHKKEMDGKGKKAITEKMGRC